MRVFFALILISSLGLPALGQDEGPELLYEPEQYTNSDSIDEQESASETVAENVPTLAPPPPVPASTPIADFVEEARDAVVRVDPIIEDSKETSGGTGILIDDRGFILTNVHVLGDAKKIRIGFADRKSVETSKIYKDTRTDLAVLKVKRSDVSGLSPIAIKSAEEMRPGMGVFTMGSPFLFDRSVSSGILSAKSRYLDILPYAIYLQTDASLNPGNSGGPLFSSETGDCIGIVNSIRSTREGTNTGVGFAIDGRQAKFVAEQLISNGQVIRGYLGASLREAKNEDFDDSDIRYGIKVSSIKENSPAAEAGLEVGDIIYMFEMESVHSINQLIFLVSSSEIGDLKRVEVLRDGKQIALDIQVEVHPSH